MARVEPYGNGAWKFWCDCEGENWNTTHPVGCTRIVNDSEPNFRCETPISLPSQKPCMIVHKLAPLVAAYEKRAKEEEARQYLFTLEKKRKEAMETLGLSEAQVNAMTGGSISGNSPKKEK